ncbi:MAG TPA: SgcJ/EcaC family oxidoreductase [Burkholderiales bacterium]|nr:SgcJ/EcaC family oxidoreductase [Burkholderiales bacterium]
MVTTGNPVRVGFFVLLLAWTCTVAAQGNVRPAIEGSNGKWVDALSRGDANGIAALYTETAKLLPANGDVVSGRQEIQKYWQGAITSGFKTVTLTTVEVESCGDTAYEVGTWTVPGEGGKVLDKGDYIVIWKLQGGQWKLHRDTWTTNTPAPGQ